jgi:cell wall-associated NlpC family hydrolase
MLFSAELNAAILAEAQATDNEICGVVIDGAPVFLENMAEDPKSTFYMPDVPDEAEAVFHSHPGGPFYPSLADMQQQISTDLPWGIACHNDRHAEVFWWGASAPKAPLVGRGFRHGVTDCYSLVQDFYSEVHGIQIMDVPRSWEWWTNDETLYESLFQEAGFVPIQLAEVQPGDAFLATIRSKTPNHAGVYIGNGLILHHTCGRDGYDPFKLSTIEPAARWFNFLHKVVRYENAEIDRTVGQKVWK